jgi:poly(3-hydroxybutyrate) depolymerase
VRLALLLALLAVAGTACSPEATRVRGGGAGADVGNHGRPIRLHEPNDAASVGAVVGQPGRR